MIIIVYFILTMHLPEEKIMSMALNRSGLLQKEGLQNFSGLTGEAFFLHLKECELKI